MQKKAFVLLSGGVDSTTCLSLAMNDFGSNVEGVSINYGQRHLKEIQQARAICEAYDIQHTILDLRGLLNGPMVMLTEDSRGKVDVPDIDYSEIKGVSPTYVPFRNGTMLAALTAHAQKYVMEQIDKQVELVKNAEVLDQEHTNEELLPHIKQGATNEAKDLVGIYFGAHAEDAFNWAYPDCTPEFIGAMANAIYIGSYFTIRLMAPFSMASKTDIIKKGAELHTSYELTWSCYKGEEKHCGTCPTCRARKAAFIAADVTDPTEYAA